MSGTRRPLALAFLGCGGATRMHSRTLRAFRGEAHLHYASRDVARAREYCHRFGGGVAYAGYDAAFADPLVDIVLVATPPALHLDLTLRALGAGKHVIVEKPAFLRSDDCDAVEQARIAAGKQVLVAENYFYKPLAGRLRTIVAEGMVGDVRVIALNALKRQGTRAWHDDAALAGGGALFEGGIHWINLMANLGLRVSAAHGFRPGRRDGLDRTVVVVLEYEGGAVGTLCYSWETPSPLRGLRLSRIFGSAGSVAFESNGLALVVMGRTTRVWVPVGGDVAGYGAMFRDFFRSLATGAAPAMDLTRARRDLELVESIYRSIGSGPQSGP